MIIHNATIHSPIERFATAMHIEGETIVWMGDEDTAHYRIKSFPEEEIIDAHGLLLTPTFHNAFLQPAQISEYHARGITAGHVFLDGAETGAPANRFDLTPISTAALDRGVVCLPTGANTATMHEFLSQEFAARTSPALMLATDDDVNQFLNLDPHRPPVQSRVYLSSGLQLPAANLMGWHVVVIVEDKVNLSLAALAQEGIPFALGGQGNPWELISRILFSANGPISARAAFNAMTRGSWRLTPGQNEPRGVLAVGAAADFALWRVDILGVQAPDSNASMWSTDERAGTPLLPVLGDGEEQPDLQSLYHRGTRVL